MELVLLVVFIMTQLGDFITTKIAIDKGGSEANPIVRAAMDKFGMAGLALYKLWASALMGYVYWSGITGEYFTALTGVLIVFYGFILFNNVKVIRVLNERT